MKAVVFHGIGDIRLDNVAEPKILQPTDAIVRITAAAICGTDLHLIRSTVADMVPGTILGHEGVGIVEEVGNSIRNFKSGDRVVIPSTMACGCCSYCRCGYYSQCDAANPHGPQAGTAFFGGPRQTGPFHGMQAEYVRVPFANIGLVKIPDEVTDDQAITLSDIFPTAYFSAKLAEIKAGDTIAIFGCGPVGQLAIASSQHLGAGRVIAIDNIPQRLAAAQLQGAEIIDFEREDPVAILHQITNGIGADRAIDAVGIDSNCAHQGPAATQTAPETHARGDNWHPGDGPSQALSWAVGGLAKAGTLSIVGYYPPSYRSFPLGMAMNKNITMQMGNCNHRKYIPHLLELVRAGAVDPAGLISQHQPLMGAIDAYQAFDRRQAGWLKVKLEPGAAFSSEAA